MSDAVAATRDAAPQARRASALALVVADSRKMPRTWLVPLAILGPLGVTLMGVIEFFIRREYLLKPYLAGTSTGWQVVTNALGMVHVFAIGLGAALVASMIMDLEHRSSTWKLLFGLPVSRWGSYVAKAAWAAALLLLSSVLMAAGYAALMVWQGLGPLPLAELAKAAVYPWIGVLPLLAVQLLLSSALRNQALPLTLGVLTPMFGMGMSRMPVWLPWRLPSQAMMVVFGGPIDGSPGELVPWLTAGRVTMVSAVWVVVLIGLGAWLLSRRDIV